MANVRGTRGIEIGNKPVIGPVIEKIVPSAGWTDDSNSHYLLVDLPGFKKEQVQLRVFSPGQIKVSGERVTKQNKTVRFDQTYEIPGPENSDTNNVRAKFDGEMLYVTIPKKPEGEEKKKKNDDVFNGQEKNNDTQQQKPDDQAVLKNQEEKITEQKPATDEAKNKELGGDDRNGSKKEEKLKEGNDQSIRFSQEDVKKWENDGDNCLRNTIKMLSQNRGIVITAVIAFSLGLLLSRR